MNRRPSIHDEMDSYEAVDYETVKLRKDIWRITPPSPAANLYLIRGNEKTILIDSGTYESFKFVEAELGKLGLRALDINLVINTHEHFDHTGGNAHLRPTALIAAHRSAAAKLAQQDEYVTHMKEHRHVSGDFSPHLWLEEGSSIFVGEYRLEILHTPGHTSGSICIYEPTQQFIFTGDTVVAGKYLTPMLESGSAGEFVESIGRLLSLKISAMYPGHGDVSMDPEKDLLWAQEAALERLDAFRDQQPSGQKRRIQIRADAQE